MRYEHPGAAFRERILREKTIRDVSRLSGVSIFHLYQISSGRKRLTPEIAAAVEKALGELDDLCIQQVQHDLELARKTNPFAHKRKRRPVPVPA